MEIFVQSFTSHHIVVTQKYEGLLTQQIFTCSKTTIETSEKGVKYDQS